MRKTLGSEAYKKAKEASHSKAWAILLDTVQKKMIFEDGYAHGWLARHRQRKKK